MLNFQLFSVVFIELIIHDTIVCFMALSLSQMTLCKYEFSLL